MAGVKRSAATGKYVSPASTRSRSSTSRSAATGKFVPGSTVKVPLGARRHKATVIESQSGLVRVAIHVPGVDEPVLSSYRPDQIG